jgi:hypothetical protein
VAAEREEYLYEVQICEVDSIALNSTEMQDDISEQAATVWRTATKEIIERQVIISGLRPLGFYCFRVRAYTREVKMIKARLPTTSDEEETSSAFSAASRAFQTIRRM